MSLEKSLQISFAGLNAQSTRLRVIAENMANAQSGPTAPGGEPYRRKVAHIMPGKGEFERTYNPSHPAADAQGYVLMPNVNPLVEMMDMHEAQRSYEANITTIDAAKAMISRTIDLLRG